MQPHERVGLEPVAADAVPAVDQRDAHVGVVDQRVRERHPGGPRADDQVVGLDARVTGNQSTSRGTASITACQALSGLWSPG